MGVSLAGEIQRISWLPVHLYMEDKCQQQNKADIMMLGLMDGRGRVPDSPVAFRPVIGQLGGRSVVSKGFGTEWGETGWTGRTEGVPLTSPPI